MKLRRPGRRWLEDLDRDIAEHIAREAEDNVARGMSPDEAHRAALRKFGNVARIKEDTRAVWTVAWVEQFIQDVRYGARVLRRSPGFTAVVIATLALPPGCKNPAVALS